MRTAAIAPTITAKISRDKYLFISWPIMPNQSIDQFSHKSEVARLLTTDWWGGGAVVDAIPFAPLEQFYDVLIRLRLFTLDEGRSKQLIKSLAVSATVE